MRTRLGLCAVALALLTACASSDLRGPTVLARAGTRTPTAGSGAPTAAANKAAAQAEADHLVATAALPPGAVRVGAQPAGLSGPALGTPSSSHLIDTVRYYTLPTSLSDARDWFQQHVQPGFTESGSTSAGGGTALYGFSYELSPQPKWSWGSADLEFELVPGSPTGTAVRVDGMAQWIDPSPVRDPSSGPAIRLTVSRGCPATDRGRHDVSNPDAPDLDRQLLPAGKPTAALQCTYDGLNGKPFLLTGSRLLTSAQAATAAARIQALPLGSLGLGGHNCPADLGRATVLAFSFSGRPDVDIWQNTSGCESTDNGHIVSGDF